MSVKVSERERLRPVSAKRPPTIHVTAFGAALLCISFALPSLALSSSSLPLSLSYCLPLSFVSFFVTLQARLARGTVLCSSLPPSFTRLLHTRLQVLVVRSHIDNNTKTRTRVQPHTYTQIYNPRPHALCGTRSFYRSRAHSRMTARCT